MKRILDVRRVGFYGTTQDDRSPEDIPLPACMASLMEALGESYPIVTIHAHERDYTTRTANREFLTASGMAFGLLWHPGLCPSALDLTQVADHDETIRRAFRWAGYEAETVCPKDGPEAAKERLRASIDVGVPVLAFGVMDPPECCLLCGYDGGMAIGWSHFQQGAQTEPNGMFRKENWPEATWKLIFPGKKVGRSLELYEILRYGREILEKTETEGYLAGQAAYDAWEALLEGAKDAGDEALRAAHDYHRSILFSLAELRCYGGDFLMERGEKEVGGCFHRIHDLCWKADAALEGGGAEALRDGDKRERLLGVLREIRREDRLALEALRARTA